MQVYDNNKFLGTLSLAKSPYSTIMNMINDCEKNKADFIKSLIDKDYESDWNYVDLTKKIIYIYLRIPYRPLYDETIDQKIKDVELSNINIMFKDILTFVEYKELYEKIITRDEKFIRVNKRVILIHY